ncbi:hypothetical protein V5O48_006321 [Marasmius crinis-equi]|uniref:Cytochrome P450 n=1 Tax=Marasmius crinis-equi TaxID=585013 RepID=A0ABR3FK37_9AGAR
MTMWTMIGNLLELFHAQAGETDFKWQAQFGGTVRFKGPFGEDRLLISDPKAIQHIFKQGYVWGVPSEQRTMSFVFAGPGLGYVEGEDHKRHRKVMNPAFGTQACKALVPVFLAAAASLSNKWKDLLSLSKEESEVINIPIWTSLATLDALGHGAFNYNFGALENVDNVLTSVYRTYFSDIFASPSSTMFIAEAIISALPQKVAIYLLKYMPDPRLARARAAWEVSVKVAGELVEAKTKQLLQGEDVGSRSTDVLSHLGGCYSILNGSSLRILVSIVRANLSGNEKARLSEDELLSQMHIIFLAGHETTATSLTWTLFELSKHPEVQSRLREEIREKERQIAFEGRVQDGLTADDLDALPYLNAVVKEILRYDTIAVHLPKMALEDDCIPLEESIALGDGKKIGEIPVRKGQRILISIYGYHRSKAIFGEDAHVFKPERWLEDPGAKNDTPFGVYSNLVSFSGGVRNCIGWRFALYELQAFIVELISNFEFSLTPECRKIRREICGRTALPVLEGELAKGPQCPLRVKHAKRDG